MIIGVRMLNLHKVQGVLDADKKVNTGRFFDRLVSIRDGLNAVEHTIDINTNTATITDSNYSEGDTVDMWLWCMKASEKGGLQPMGSPEASDESLIENATF
jgi:hypothetical protein